MYGTSLPPRPNNFSRVSESYAPRFSSKEFPLLPINRISSWRTPPSKIWGENEGTDRATRYTRDSSARKLWNSLREKSINRLHVMQTHNISDRSIDSGLIPLHLLDGSIPPATKPVSSIDFFPPCERLPTAPPIRMGHQLRLIREIPEDQLQAYKKGEILQDVPVRIVKHTSKDRTYLKKSANQNPRGISRNILGGFYTS